MDLRNFEHFGRKSADLRSRYFFFFPDVPRKRQKLIFFLPKIAPNWLKMSHFVYLGAFYGFEKFRKFRPKVRRFAVPILLFFSDVPRKRQKLIFCLPKIAPNWLKISHFVYLGAFYRFEKFWKFQPKVRWFAVAILLFFSYVPRKRQKLIFCLPKIATNWLKISHFVYLGTFCRFEKFRKFRPKVRRFAVPILHFFSDVPRKRQKLIFFCPKLLQIG